MEIEPASHDKFISFMDKLGELRGRLSPDEQDLLDRMTAAMLTGEVEDPASDIGTELERRSTDPGVLPSNKTYYAQVAHILKS